MGLVELGDGTMTAVEGTTFAAEGVLERQHLQAALRDNIALLDEDLMVIAEEYGDFEGAHRRIDLLCIDRQGRPVVVELKRTNDGGHMELQALRYAAMVSTMTDDDLERIFAAHLTKMGHDANTAQQQLNEWRAESDDDDESVARDDGRMAEVRIMLVAADFSTEITTTVLWLSDLYGLDITCVRLTPYRLGERVLVDIAQVIPLPEAEELTVKLRRRATEVRASKSGGSDYTRFRVRTPDGVSEPLKKRWAMLEMVSGLVRHGVEPSAIVNVLPSSTFLSMDGEIDDPEEARAKFINTYPSANASNIGRWFSDYPIVTDGQTWLLTKQWGIATEELLGELASLHDSGRFGFEAIR